MNYDTPIVKNDYTQRIVKSQLNKILTDHLFVKSKILSSFLKFVVTETLDGNGGKIKEYTIATMVLGRGQDFDPREDAIVRIHAGRLRKLLDKYYSQKGEEDPIKIELVKGSYVPVFREQARVLNQETEPTNFSRNKLTLVILPFRNLCENGEFQYFADGLGEELTGAFSNFEDIDVIAHHSAREYISFNTKLDNISADLGVHYVITGTVMKSAYEIRANVTLIETLTNFQVWSNNYTHTWNEQKYFKILDNIVSDVVSLLGGYYGFMVQNRIKNMQHKLQLDSLDATLLNYYFHMNFTEENYLKTRKVLESVVASEPLNAKVKAMLAELYLDAYVLGFPTVDNPVEVGFQLAKEATTIDSNCQHGFQELGWAYIYLKKKEEAIKSLETCLRINPSSVSSMGAIGFGMVCLGEYERAMELLEKSLALNPHCPWWFHFGFFLIYYKKKLWTKAYQHGKLINAEVFFNPMIKSIINLKLTKHSEAHYEQKRFYDQYPELPPNLEEILAVFLHDNEIITELISDFNSVKSII
ncbi:tetratricopeptide repeat protein [Flexithrix dorotheae]|uniref:tetratricopeptide repeat protein n=1 Tax=Flexithrix dorotheae TaxID=70993 RepID=UPI00037ECD41|nr:tetratricopeptide repeat protein [Flexithrix dorotheae]